MAALMSVDELSDTIGEVTVLDVRWELGRTDGHERFLAGHVPGAAFVDLPHDLADPPGSPVDDRGRHPLPSPARFTDAMRRCGVRADRAVVLYDDWGGLAAARAWWLLRHHGHDDVRLLDGGWPAWIGAGGPVEKGEEPSEPGDFTATPGRLPVLDAASAARVARDGVLLDARAPERYRGETEPLDPVAGHVPGAVSLPTSRNLDERGRWRSRAELAEAYAVTDGAGEVGAYCGSGVTAAHDLFALHLLGREGALYAGSWSGWTSDPGRPVATSGRP
jgi:thiosulfate/3-mercaptopyruvate sulfurtransferase